MNALVIILAVIGLCFLLLLAIAALDDKAPAPLPVEDPSTPYREGLHAAVRMQRVAQDLEQQIYAEAAQHMGGEAEQSGAQRQEAG